MRFKVYSTSSRKVILNLLWLSALSLTALAQQNKLAVSPPQQVNIKRGGTATATLKVNTLPGFHVNSDKPTGEYVIPLQLTWSAGPLNTQFISYPKAQDLKVGDETLSVFTGTFSIQTEFKAPGNAPSGASAMTGKLHYQACNNLMCFRPSTIDVRLPVVIE